MKRQIDSVVFDLDGTLIDSAPGILQSFALAFERCGVVPIAAWSPALIGPPLQETISQQCALQDPLLLERIRQAFISCYDTQGYRQSVPYVGINETLQSMRKDKLRLFIATNKRIVPTRRILAHLGWGPMFEGVFGVDSLEKAQTPKFEVIRRISHSYGLTPARSLYVGDRYEDYQAAALAGMPFALATWGFGDANHKVPGHCARMTEAESLYLFVKAGSSA